MSTTVFGVTFLFTDTMLEHLDKNLRDLSKNSDSVISKCQALDHTLWPKLGDDRESKQKFVVHGKEEMRDLCAHYSKLLEKNGHTEEEVMGEYRLYKTWARKETQSMRETLLKVLRRGILYSLK